MAADLYIHIRTPEITDHVLSLFFGNTLGTRWFNPRTIAQMDEAAGNIDPYAIISHTPKIWVGEVSWLKAVLFGDSETYVPSMVEAVYEAIDDSCETLITDELIEKVRAATRVANKTSYSLGEADKILDFLTTYKGQRCFTVSW